MLDTTQLFAFNINGVVVSDSGKKRITASENLIFKKNIKCIAHEPKKYRVRK